MAIYSLANTILSSINGYAILLYSFMNLLHCVFTIPYFYNNISAIGCTKNVEQNLISFHLLIYLLIPMYDIMTRI